MKRDDGSENYKAYIYADLTVLCVVVEKMQGFNYFLLEEKIPHVHA